MKNETPVSWSRRSVLKSGASFLAFPALALGEEEPSNTVRVGVMGLQRGLGHIRALSRIKGVEIAAVCDVDSERLDRGVSETERYAGSTPAAYEDFRRILDDKEIDALTIAAPNHWHTPASVLACEAGKHVYVEKPASYCAEEARLIVRAAKKHKRLVQMGNQRRSNSSYAEAMQRIHEGAIGTVRSARTFYMNTRGTIGTGKRAKVPENLNYDLWQGPAPRKRYRDNLIHYNWHWRWHWGNGELGNNGIHALDLARWALDVDLPETTVCHGGRYHFDDDQETPDTTSACFDFGHVFVTWDGTSCHARIPDELPFLEVYGDEGSVKIGRLGDYQIYDADGIGIGGRKSTLSDIPHFGNFINAIRDGEPLNAEIRDAQKSTMLCHLGNIAFRTKKVVRTPKPGAKKKPKFWARNYEDGWEVKV